MNNNRTFQDKSHRFKTIGLYRQFVPCGHLIGAPDKNGKEEQKVKMCEELDNHDDPEYARKFGFPNTKVDPIDEATLLLTEKYDDIISDPERYRIWTFHFPQKGDEQDLLYWHCLRAKPYLDIQALLVKAAKKTKLEGDLITRIFVFRKPQNLLELKLNAFMTIFEQNNIGVKCVYTTSKWMKRLRIKYFNNDLLLITKDGIAKLYLIRVEDSDKEIPYGAKFYACYGHSWQTIPKDHKWYLDQVFDENKSRLELKDTVEEILFPLDFKFCEINKWNKIQTELWAGRGCSD